MRLFPHLCVGLFCVLIVSSLTGQPLPDHRYLAAEIANDVFYLPLKTDRYFTSGMQFEYGRITTDDTTSSNKQPVINRQYWNINQDLFTPDAIDSPVLVPEDRPFASYLTLSRGREWQLPQAGLRLRQQWTAGVLGRYSMGGKMQNSFHGMINFAEEVPGWVHEVNPDVVLNYELEIERQYSLGKAGRVGLGTVFRGGTLYTDFRPAANLFLRPVRFGKQDYLYAKLAASSRLVGYNATLSGGLFNRDDRYRDVIQPHRVVHQLGASGGLTVNGYVLEGGVRWLSPEFRGGMNHLWAWFGIRVR